MSGVRRSPLPDCSLLRTYAETPGCYTDCYARDVDGLVKLSDFVTNFYTTPLFKVERFILHVFVSHASTDHQARQLSEGRSDQFAAWKTEGRTDDQLLMCDITGRTRSWFMIAPMDGSGPSTRLYFGSAIVPAEHLKSVRDTLGFPFNALLGFHKLYSRALLSAAAARTGK
jgi:hypothetical protein